ncbi:ATP-binding cassette domain-containing protein [Finegoldia sp. P2-F-LR]
MLKILANILSNTSGNLYLNESEYSIHKNISQMISFVSQETFIFNDTLKNNITLYNEYSDEETNKAIEFSLLDSLKDRKMNENSNLQDTLSGGERKKIGLARAILNDTDVILLDELNSSLDSTSSKILEDRIFDLKDKTIVMVTHKINYHNLVKADEIICMDDGEIVENGNLEELLEKQGYFYRNFGELYGKYFRD